MTLKNATLLAIIGSVLGIVSKIFYALSNFGIYELPFSFYKVLGLLNLISSIFFIIFFCTLYSNQNKRKKQREEV